MRLKCALVWLLGIAALLCQFVTVMALRDYAAFYGLPRMLSSVIAVMLVYISVMVLRWAERKPHRWWRYAPFYLVFAFIGLFVPAVADEQQLAFAIVGMMPLVLMSGMWAVKRYWTIRV
ncbi:hypothetical protein MF451_003746 [Salmonella enterica subsp. enterica serovar Saintpaul]|nr:hypothetical protein [Salmonella enterica subsp. enterica serovar Saintpaul]